MNIAIPQYLTLSIEPNNVTQIASASGIVLVALVQCFFGFKLLKFIVSFWGLSLFGFVGYNIGFNIGGQTAAVIAGIISGAIGALIAFKFYKAGVFLQGFVAGVMVGMISAILFGWEPSLIFTFAAVIGILVGLLTVYLFKPMVILTSAVSGGETAGIALAGLFGFAPNVGVFIGVILSVLGILYQTFGGLIRTGKKEKESKEDNKAVEPGKAADADKAEGAKDAAVAESIPISITAADVISAPTDEHMPEPADSGVIEVGELPEGHGAFEVKDEEAAETPDKDADTDKKE